MGIMAAILEKAEVYLPADGQKWELVDGAACANMKQDDLAQPESSSENRRSEQFFEDVNAAFTRLKADPKAWEEELAERRLWEVTLADGSES